MASLQLSTKEAAAILGIRITSVTSLIRSGQIRAADVSLNPGGKPRWRIDPEEVESFLRRRMHTVPPKRRRRQRPKNVKKYF